MSESSIKEIVKRIDDQISYRKSQARIAIFIAIFIPLLGLLLTGFHIGSLSNEIKHRQEVKKLAQDINWAAQEVIDNNTFVESLAEKESENYFPILRNFIVTWLTEIDLPYDIRSLPVQKINKPQSLSSLVIINDALAYRKQLEYVFEVYNIYKEYELGRIDAPELRDIPKDVVENSILRLKTYLNIDINEKLPDLEVDRNFFISLSTSKYRYQLLKNLREEAIVSLIVNISLPVVAGQEASKGIDPNFYIIATIMIITFGTMMALYRSHLKEVSELEKSRMGFIRINFAAENSNNEGYGTEVRQSLTFNAFDNAMESTQIIDNPLPGNIASDVSSKIANSVLNEFFNRSNKGNNSQNN